MNFYLTAVIGLILFDYVLNLLVHWLDARRDKSQVPGEFAGLLDAAKYATSRRYQREGDRFELVSSSIMTPLTLGFILLGGFAWVDQLARAPGWGMIPTGLLFGGILLLISQVVGLPFSLYSTFVIEERYGFNRTTARTFILDRLKGLLLGLALGGAVFAAVLWFFAAAGPLAWLYSWLAVTGFQLVLVYLAPVYIMPLFNKFSPLPEGPLRSAIEDYARREGFALKGIYTMDGSKRSTKANAFFTGFGRWRRIVLFDTLVEKHTVEELVAVLAHEVGHFKLRHILRMMLVSVLASGAMFFVLSLFIRQPGLYEAFGLSFEPIRGVDPIYAGMVFFGFLYSPINLLLSLAVNALSRRHEFEADAFAARTAGTPEALVSALKRLSVDSLSDLEPHPFKVVLEYSHPPVLERIRALRAGAVT